MFLVMYVGGGGEGSGYVIMHVVAAMSPYPACVLGVGMGVGCSRCWFVIRCQYCGQKQKVWACGVVWWVEWDYGWLLHQSDRPSVGGHTTGWWREDACPGDQSVWNVTMSNVNEDVDVESEFPMYSPL